MDKTNIDELERQLEYMRLILADARESFASEPLVIEYDNGGGQSGIRKNPFYEAYSQMVKTYTTALRCYKELSEGKPATAPKLAKFEAFAKTMNKAAND